MVETPPSSLNSGVDAMPYGTALHENNWMVPILARDRSREAKDEPRFRSARHQLERRRRDVVALIDHKMSVTSHEVGYLAFPHKTLD